MTKKVKTDDKKLQYYRLLYDAIAVDGRPFRPNAEIVIDSTSLEQAIRDLRRSTRSECKGRRGVDATVEVTLIERVSEREHSDFLTDAMTVAEPVFQGLPGPTSTADYERQLAKVRRRR